jgi:hypothetical protein
MSTTTVKKKAVVKKTTKPRVIKKITQDELIKELEKLNFTIRHDIDEDDNWASYHIHNKKERLEAQFEFQFNTLGYCCGVIEVGSIRKVNTSVDKKVINLLISIAFLHIKDQYIEGSGGTRPILFCSNGEYTCKEIENAFETTLKDHYKLVSTTKNPNSGNTIKMYISY